MKSLVAIILTIVLCSCGSNSSSDKNDLLTSSTWTVEKGSIDGDMPKSTEKYKFLTDGTYLLEAGEVSVKGNWMWTKDDEIFLQAEGILLGEQVNKFDSSINSYLRIVELTDKTLQTIERNQADAWDSGFAKEKVYTANL